MPTIRVQLTEQNYVDAVLAAAALRRRRSVTLAVNGLAIVAASVLVLAWWAYLGFRALVIVGAVLGALIGGRIGQRRSIIRQARKVFGQQKAIHQPFEATWDTSGVRLTSDYGTSTIPWSDFRQCREIESQFLLFLSDVNFLMLPKAAFDGPPAVAEFRRLLETCSTLGRAS